MANMFIGHGGFALVMGKPTLIHLYEAAGLGGVGVPLPTISVAIGGFEMLLEVLCLEVNVEAFFFFVCVEAWHRVVTRASPGLWGVVRSVGARQYLCRPPVVDRCAAGAHRPRGHCPRADPRRLAALACWGGSSRGGAHRAIGATRSLSGEPSHPAISPPVACRLHVRPLPCPFVNLPIGDLCTEWMASGDRNSWSRATNRHHACD